MYIHVVPIVLLVMTGCSSVVVVRSQRAVLLLVPVAVSRTLRALTAAIQSLRSPTGRRPRGRSAPRPPTKSLLPRRWYRRSQSRCVDDTIVPYEQQERPHEKQQNVFQTASRTTNTFTNVRADASTRRSGCCCLPESIVCCCRRHCCRIFRVYCAS